MQAALRGHGPHQTGNLSAHLQVQVFAHEVHVGDAGVGVVDDEVLRRGLPHSPQNLTRSAGPFLPRRSMNTDIFTAPEATAKHAISTACERCLLPIFIVACAAFLMIRMWVSL